MSEYFQKIPARLAGALPAAGAYDAEPIAVPVNGMELYSFLISYTRGAGGGSSAYKVEICADDNPSTGEWYQIAYVEGEPVVTGSDLQNKTQRVEFLYGATGVLVERFTSPSFSSLTNFVRIVFKEVGQIATPGSVTAYCVIKSNQ